MDIIVCIKQVPGTTSVQIDPKTNTIIRQGVESIVNPFDMYAIEEALRLKETMEGKVIALSMGPPQAEAALKEAISLGADEGILLSDRLFAGADTWATAYTLSKAIGKIGHYDLIICGKQTMDGDTGQVGPELASILDIPYVCNVKKIEQAAKRFLRLERMVEEGYEVLEMPLPGLITVTKEINEPRLPSLRGKLTAKNTVIPVWSASEIKADPDLVGLAGSPTQVVKIFTPQKICHTEMLEGDVETQVELLINKLRETKLI